MIARTAFAAALLLLLGGCSEASTSEASDPTGASSTPAVVDDRAPFTHRAAAACTQAVNSALTSVLPPAVEVLEATQEEVAPDAEQIDAWATAYDDRLAKLRGIRQVLSSVKSTDAADQAAWQIVIDSDLVEVAETEKRRDLLATGDWERIESEFAIVTASIDFEMVPVQPAIDQLGLNQSDCIDVYAMAPVPEGTESFLTEVTSTCLATTLRRLDANTAVDRGTVLDALATTQQGDDLDTAALSSLQEALERLVAEWEQTTSDLDAIAATPPDEAAWGDVLDAAQERVDVHTARLAAVRAGDPAQITTALMPDWEHPVLDFPAAGVERGICRALAG